MRIVSLKFYFLFLITIALLAASCSSHKGIATTLETKKGNEPESANIQNRYATLLNVDNKKIDNTQLYSFIDEWYKTPYKYGGHTKKGIDCSNFASTLYSQVYHKSITGSSLSISKQCKTVSKSNLTEGDLVFFKIDNGDVSHIGVYLQNNKFVHATTKKGVIIDDMDEPYYKKYFYAGGRLK